MAGETKEFPEWFLRLLQLETAKAFDDSLGTIWDALDRMLLNRGVRLPSDLSFQELQQLLHDISTAATARLAGLQVSPATLQRLAAIGITLPALTDFPGLAYRMGTAYRQLITGAQTPDFNLLRNQVEALPLSSVEREAAQYARQRAGMFLRPIYDDAGVLWSVDRELEPLRERVGGAIENRLPARRVANDLRNSQRAEGIRRDADRVIVTEMAEARTKGSWSVESKDWTPETKLFRQTGAEPCRGCLRLQKNPDGTPRLYTRAEVEAGEAMGPNTGNWRSWHVRVGPSHPACRDAPWQEYFPAMASVFERHAPRHAELIRQLNVFEDAA